MKSILTALSFATAVCAVTPVFAQSAPDGTSAGPVEAPGYSRGRTGGRPVTLAEFQARYRDRLMRADTDHDGRISLAEFMATLHAQPGADGEGRGGDPQRQFQRLDANHDGFITPAEIDAVSAERFARMDANQDGVVTPEERMAARGGGYGGPGGGAVQPLPPPQ